MMPPSPAQPAAPKASKSEKGLPGRTGQRQQPPASLQECGQPASWCVCACRRVDVCVHHPASGPATAHIGDCGLLPAHRLPAVSPGWSGPGSVYGASSCATIYSLLFSPASCPMLLCERGHQPGLSAAVTPSRTRLAWAARKALPFSWPSVATALGSPDSSHLERFLSSCPCSASAKPARVGRQATVQRLS